MSLSQKIKNETQMILDEIIEIRHYLHQNPELSFKEYNTSKYIQDKLSEWDIPFEAGYVETGIVVTLKSGVSEKNIALRADIDALPILESSNERYCSQNEGVMHACGHDAHTSSLLGTLKILKDNKDLWSGCVTALFQPGEEVLPGGAKLMIEEGALNSNPDFILGQHVYPDLEAGKIGVRGGQYMASCDELHLTINGAGGHAALPHKITDTVYITSQLIVSLQQIISRKISPFTPAVLSFGYINADGATNVIPNQVIVKGTFRCMDEKWRSIAHDEIQKISNGLVNSMGGEIEIEIRKGYPALINDFSTTAHVKSCAIEYLGSENVIDLDLRMTAEDFSYYSQIIPACFYRFGTAEKGKESEKKLHHPKFDIEERLALETSIGVMAFSAIKYLS